MVSCILLENLTGRHLRAARAMLGWQQATLAKRAAVALGTVRRMESTNGQIVSSTLTLGRVRDALTAAGIEFCPFPVVGVVMNKPPQNLVRQ